MLDIFSEVAKIISPVYMVGGSIRDLLLKQRPKDYDFATPLLPDEIEQRIITAGKKPLTHGKRFGTIGVLLHNHKVEITTFRLESYSPGSRKPSVQYVDNITYDLSRRDFTINAMARRADGHLIDPFGGKEDLRQGLIRTVGKPAERFKEDPLRMLRAARFAAQLDFLLDGDTEHKMQQKAAAILSVSKERWTSELDKLLMSPKPAIGLDILAQTRLLVYMLPELAIQIGYNQDSPYHELDLWQHTLKTVSLSSEQLDVRWAALFHDIGKPYVRTKNRRGYSNYVDHEIVGAEMVSKLGKYLKFSNDRLGKIEKLVREHLNESSPLLTADAAATRRNGINLTVR